MVDVIELSPQNEMPVAQRLAADIRAVWPDVAISPHEHVTLLVGIETVREIDLLVVIRLQKPRELPPILRRDGSTSARDYVQGAVLPDQLGDVNPWILGNEASWLGFIDAAAQRNPEIYERRSHAYMASLDSLVNLLTRRRVVSPRDRMRASNLCNDELAEKIVSELAEVAGKKLIRLTGRGGSGKTTTLALLAKHLAIVGGERVLILTFHRALRSDIAHLIACTSDVPGVAGRRIVVETATTFFMSVLESFDYPLQTDEQDRPSYGRLDAALDELRFMLDGEKGDDMAELKSRLPQRFDFDYVFVDEAQDWSDAERDFLREMYGSSRLVLADGLEQLVRRQTVCDWIAGIPSTERVAKHLGRSLRMSRNLAEFANAVARESGLSDWKIAPFDKLPGGRIVISVGGEVDVVALHAAVRDAAAIGKAVPIDTLTCIPPRSKDDITYSDCARKLLAARQCVWDATKVESRDEAPDDVECWRLVKYDSCRGLEGWVTVALGLDQLIASKIKYPNLAPGETESPEGVARRWLMIALTRAVSVLIITITDPDAPVVATLRVASATLADGIVQWTTPERLADMVAPATTSTL
jgi:hypothetical protein